MRIDLFWKNKPFFKIFLIVAFVSLHNSAIGQEIVFTPRVETGVWLFDSKLSYFDEDEDRSKTWFELTDFMAVLQVGGNLQWREFYMDAYLQQSTSGSDDPNNETLLSDGINSYANQEADIERSEFSFLLGYQFFSQASLFAGYRFQETKIEETLPPNSQIITDGRPPDTWDISIDSKGPFLGATYLIPIRSNHSFATTISIGFYEQEYDHAYTQVIGGGGGGLSKLKMLFDFETDVIDLGLGLSYTHQLTKKFDFNVVGQLNYYSFDERVPWTTRWGDGFTESVGDHEIEAEEFNFQLRAGLQYRF